MGRGAPGGGGGDFREAGAGLSVGCPDSAGEGGGSVPVPGWGRGRWFSIDDSVPILFGLSLLRLRFAEGLLLASEG